MKKETMRMCAKCRELKPKTELLRVVMTEPGVVCMDESGRRNGRGAYICKSAECLTSARKNRVFERAFKTSLPSNIYDEIESFATNNLGCNG